MYPVERIARHPLFFVPFMVGGSFYLAIVAQLILDYRQHTAPYAWQVKKRAAPGADLQVMSNAEACQRPRINQGRLHQRLYLAQLADRAALCHGLDRWLFRALALQESAWNPGATSSKGAGGLVQLMRATAAEFYFVGTAQESCGLKTNKARYEVWGNLKCGAAYLALQLKNFCGDVRLALAAYNAGPAAVKKYGRRYFKGCRKVDGVYVYAAIPNYPETKGYVAKITKRWSELKDE